jgi:Leucine-rich repeat (LRR) protein
MMTTDANFAMWRNVKVLNLYDNNLVRMGSLAPLVSLEELRLNGNNLEEVPTLAASHPKLSVFEMHKNRVASIPETYFAATPALARLSIWGNQLKTLPQSLLDCFFLKGIQAQDNQLESLPDGKWPISLETIFLQNNSALTKLPASLAKCPELKRVNLTNLQLDPESLEISYQIRSTCLEEEDGIFWSPEGDKILGSDQ